MRTPIGIFRIGATGSLAGKPPSFGEKDRKTVELAAFHPQYVDIPSAFSKDPLCEWTS